MPQAEQPPQGSEELSRELQPRRIENRSGEEQPGQVESHTADLLRGDWKTIAMVVSVLITDRPEAWQELETGKLTTADWVVDEEVALTWGQVFGMVQFVNALVEEEYPFIKRFGDDPGSDVIQMAKRLEAFVQAPSLIAAFHNGVYPGDKAWE